MFNLVIKTIDALDTNESSQLNCKNKMFSKKADKIEIIIHMSEDKKKLKSYIKRLMRCKNNLLKKHNIIIILDGFKNEEILHNQFRELISTICYEDKYKIYSKAYDLACDYLDSYFYGKNLCDFCNNRCGYKKDYNIEVGCCRHFEKHRQFGMLLGEKLVNCEYLGSDNHCTIKCLGCKLYTCSYLDGKGIRLKQKDIFPIDSIFNWRQKIYIKSVVYRPKEYIMKRLMFLL